MGQPQRIQLSRAKGFRLQEASMALNGLPAVKVDRSTPYGNPWRAVRENWGKVCWVLHEPPWAPDARRLFPERETKGAALSLAVDKHEEWIRSGFGPKLDDLVGKNIACWCPIGAKCHGDIYVKLANPEVPA